MTATTPTFWLLDGQTGWKSATPPANDAPVTVSVGTELRLAADPAGPQALGSPYDNLGGLILPRGMGVDEQGRLYLAGAESGAGWVKRFDRLRQNFVTLPLLDEREQAARRFSDPTSIACAGGNLYIFDYTSREILVFALATLALRHRWRLPPAAAEPGAATGEDSLDKGQSGDLAAYQRSVFILDGYHGRVYRHEASAESLRLCLDCPHKQGCWTRLAVDRTGDLYLFNQQTGRLEVYALNPQTQLGEFKHAVSDAGAVQDRFDPPGIVLDSPAPQGADIRWRFGLPAQLVTDLAFRLGDLVDPVSLAQALESACDPLTRYLKERLTPANKQVLAAFWQGESSIDALVQALLGELNRHLQNSHTMLVQAPIRNESGRDHRNSPPATRHFHSSGLYDRQQFAQAPLTPQLVGLAKRPATGAARMYIHRLLLEQAFAPALKPAQLVRYGTHIPPAARTAGLSFRQSLISIPTGLVFDHQGQPVTGLDPADVCDVAVYRATGVWISTALDSEIYRCQWHRIELDLAALPAGAQVTVLTYTAERELRDSEIATIDASFWDKSFTFTGQERPPVSATAAPPKTGDDSMAPGRLDCLVQSREGRYLWLRLEFRGNGDATPVVRSVRIHYPRNSYLDYLPAVFSSDDESRWLLERFLALFQTEWDDLDQRIAELYRYYDPKLVPDTHLGYLANLLALPLEGMWSSAQKRRLLAAAPPIYASRGSLDSLQRYLQIYLHNLAGSETEQRCKDHEEPAPDGCDCGQSPCGCAKTGCVQSEGKADPAYPLIVEGFRERWYVMLAQENQAHLGHGVPLWGAGAVSRLQLDVFAQEGEVRLVSTGDPERDLFYQYAHRFRVFMPAAWVCTAEDELLLRRALDAEKPAHTHYDLCLVEARLRVGLQSTVGIDTIIGPQPVAQLTEPEAQSALPATAAPRHQLGYDTLLAGRPAGESGVRLAPQVRVGLDTTLN